MPADPEAEPATPDEEVATPPRRDPALRWAFGAASAALALRGVYLWEYAEELPFLFGPVGDSQVYLRQAHEVLDGVRPTPALLALSPLPGYVFAAAEALGDVLLAVGWQLLLGVLEAGTLAWLARRTLGRAGALAIVLGFLGYGLFPYFEVKLLGEGLGLALALGSVLLSFSARFRAGKPLAALGVGALAGLATLARASLVFHLPLLVLVSLLPVWSSELRRGRRALARGAGVMLGIALVLGANGARNEATSGRFVPIIMVSRTLENASGAEWGGRLDSVRMSSRAASPGDAVRAAERELAGGEGDDAAAAPRPGLFSALSAIDYAGYLGALPGKLWATLSPREISFQYGYLGERGAVPIAGALPFSFGSLLVLGALGLATALRRRRWDLVAALAPLTLGALAATTLYHPSTRYRLGLVWPLLLASAYAVQALWDTRRERGSQLMAAIVGGALTLSVVGSYRTQLGNPGEWYLQIAASHGLAGDHEAAREWAARAHAVGDVGVRTRAERILRFAPRR